MTTSDPEVIDRSVQKTRQWIAEVAAELDIEDGRAAYRALKAVLHTLRDRVPVNEAAQLAAQLPELLRGAYYEDWVPAHTPQRYREREEFLRRVADGALLAGNTEASYVVGAAMAVLRRHISAGEIEDVIAVMPRDIRQLLQASG
jgi:uncharacterized protein (DUF2267 family)